MPIQKGVLPDNLYVNLIIDGKEFNYATTININHEVNNARSLICEFAGNEALEACRLGAIVEFSYHKNSPTKSVFDDALSFKGVIKSISPSENISSFVALDYITYLAESEYVFYEAKDYVGEDLYFAAADACNYKGIDVSRLVSGSGIFITKDMNLFGWKTRKEFIDACFDEMKVLVDDNQHPRNTINQWYYGIRKNNIMDFFLPDSKLEGAFEYFTISKNNNNITEEGIISSIDTSQMVNAITIVSKSDETIYVQIKDEGSIAKHGIVSRFLSYDSTNESILEDVGYKILSRLNKPSVYYNIVTTDMNDISLGDLIKIDIPSSHAAFYSAENTLPLIGYQLSITDRIVVTLKVGDKPIPIKEQLEILSKPTDR
tara:strand:+ start:2356 stop:3477 length:1122 start_codon:yes stop_codon:yes gene_type:complete